MAANKNGTLDFPAIITLPVVVQEHQVVFSFGYLSTRLMAILIPDKECLILLEINIFELRLRKQAGQ